MLEIFWMHSEDEMENAQDVCDIKTEKEDDVVEEAAVHVEGTAGYNCAEMDCNGAPAKMHQQAEQWSCHCKQSKLWRCWMVILDRDALTSFPQRSVWKWSCLSQKWTEVCSQIILIFLSVFDVKIIFFISDMAV